MNPLILATRSRTARWIILAVAAGTATLIAAPLIIFAGGGVATSVAATATTPTTCAAPAQPVDVPKTGALTRQQVTAVAAGAGFTGKDLTIAVAVARAESGWNPTATNRNTNGSTDYGLWQINTINASVLATGDWSNPNDNARMAHTLWQQWGNWNAWVTYKTGAYLPYLEATTAPAPTSCPATGQAATGGTCKGMSVAISHYGNGRIPASALCKLKSNPAHMLRADAANTFDQMSDAYAARFKHPICVTDSYRDYATQVRLKREKGGLAATPGTSNHGWGTATDLCDGVNISGSVTHQWLAANAPRYGWENPAWAQPGAGGPFEPWHFEYIAGRDGETPA